MKQHPSETCMHSHTDRLWTWCAWIFANDPCVSASWCVTGPQGANEKQIPAVIQASVLVVLVVPRSRDMHCFSLKGKMSIHEEINYLWCIVAVLERRNPVFLTVISCVLCVCVCGVRFVASSSGAIVLAARRTAALPTRVTAPWSTPVTTQLPSAWTTSRAVVPVRSASTSIHRPICRPRSRPPNTRPTRLQWPHKLSLRQQPWWVVGSRPCLSAYHSWMLITINIDMIKW